jgi:hypothetical protein
MKILQQKFSEQLGWETVRNPAGEGLLFNLVLVFGPNELIGNETLYNELRAKFADAVILLSSTAGEISDTVVSDNTLSLTAIAFEHTTIKHAGIHLHNGESSYDAGARLAQHVDQFELKNVLIISDGQHVNGSELVRGLQHSLHEDILITGGLAGDGVRFTKTVVGLNCPATENYIAAIAFYGDALTVESGSVGGWDPFGPQRLITRSKGNILYELDGQPALDVYKKYLGEYAAQLPSAGLLFPLSIKNGGNYSLVRTILAVNEEDSSVVFAGNMPEGYYARLMKAGFDRLIEGASEAAYQTLSKEHNEMPDLALLISCVGRKLVLNQRVEEEVEIIREVYGDHTAITGFYSYGEISPSYNSPGPELHNQTMTITTFTERKK